MILIIVKVTAPIPKAHNIPQIIMEITFLQCKAGRGDVRTYNNAKYQMYVLLGTKNA